MIPLDESILLIESYNNEFQTTSYYQYYFSFVKFPKYVFAAYISKAFQLALPKYVGVSRNFLIYVGQILCALDMNRIANKNVTYEGAFMVEIILLYFIA